MVKEYNLDQLKQKQSQPEDGLSEIFELINILIKMVRIFSHLQGPYFIDNSKKIEVSPFSSATSSSASRLEGVSITTTLTRQSSSTTQADLLNQLR